MNVLEMSNIILTFFYIFVVPLSIILQGNIAKDAKAKTIIVNIH